MAGVAEAGGGWGGAKGQTVSDQIRALNAAGHSRADIARLLGKRYQHVRNVLEADKVKGRPTSQPPDDDSVKQHMGPGSYRMIVRPDGSVMLPLAVREALGMAPGSAVLARLEGVDLVLTEGDAAGQRMRDFVRANWKGGRSIVDELIAERRAEAARE